MQFLHLPCNRMTFGFNIVKMAEKWKAGGDRSGNYGGCVKVLYVVLLRCHPGNMVTEQLSGIKIGTRRLTSAGIMSRWFTIIIKDRFLIISHYSIIKLTNRISQRHHRTHIKISNSLSFIEWARNQRNMADVSKFRFFRFFLATLGREST